MIECNELTGKTVRSLRLYPLGIEGAEVWIEFTDGTSFTASLKMVGELAAKISRGEGADFQVVKDYIPADSHRDQ